LIIRAKEESCNRFWYICACNQTQQNYLKCYPNFFLSKFRWGRCSYHLKEIFVLALASPTRHTFNCSLTLKKKWSKKENRTKNKNKEKEKEKTKYCVQCFQNGNERLSGALSCYLSTSVIYPLLIIFKDHSHDESAGWPINKIFIETVDCVTKNLIASATLSPWLNMWINVKSLNSNVPLSPQKGWMNFRFELRFNRYLLTIEFVCYLFIYHIF